MKLEEPSDGGRARFLNSIPASGWQPFRSFRDFAGSRAGEAANFCFHHDRFPLRSSGRGGDHGRGCALSRRRADALPVQWPMMHGLLHRPFVWWIPAPTAGGRGCDGAKYCRRRPEPVAAAALTISAADADDLGGRRDKWCGTTRGQKSWTPVVHATPQTSQHGWLRMGVGCGNNVSGDTCAGAMAWDGMWAGRMAKEG